MKTDANALLIMVKRAENESADHLLLSIAR
jgi:hypothetical protein